MGKRHYDKHGNPLTLGQCWTIFKKQYIKEVEEYLLLDKFFSIDDHINLNYLKKLDPHTRHNKIMKEFCEYLDCDTVYLVEETNQLVKEHIELLENKRNNSLHQTSNTGSV